MENLYWHQFSIENREGDHHSEYDMARLLNTFKLTSINYYGYNVFPQLQCKAERILIIDNSCYAETLFPGQTFAAFAVSQNSFAYVLEVFKEVILQLKFLWLSHKVILGDRHSGNIIIEFSYLTSKLRIYQIDLEEVIFVENEMIKSMARDQEDLINLSLRFLPAQKADIKQHVLDIIINEDIWEEGDYSEKTHYYDRNRFRGLLLKLENSYDQNAYSDLDELLKLIDNALEL